MRRFVAGLLIAHAIGHAYIGASLPSQRASWLAAALWCTAVIGFAAGGLGLFRVPYLRNAWERVTFVAVVASLLLCVWSMAWWVIPAIVIDVAILVFVLQAAEPRFDADIAVVNAVGASCFKHPAWVKTGWSIGTAVLLYLATTVFARPIIVRWGTSEAERLGKV